MQDQDFDQDRAERLIANLRTENQYLKRKLHDERQAAGMGLPPSWQKRFADLRKQNAKYRIERNEARAELAALRTESV
jgi:hypothetical protein